MHHGYVYVEAIDDAIERLRAERDLIVAAVERGDTDHAHHVEAVEDIGHDLTMLDEHASLFA